PWPVSPRPWANMTVAVCRATAGTTRLALRVADIVLNERAGVGRGGWEKPELQNRPSSNLLSCCRRSGFGRGGGFARHWYTNWLALLTAVRPSRLGQGTWVNKKCGPCTCRSLSGTA